MNVILFSRREGRARQFDLAHPVTLGIVAALALGVLGTAFALGLQLGSGHTRSPLARRVVPLVHGPLGAEEPDR